jgi:hypothetical protein
MTPHRVSPCYKGAIDFLMTKSRSCTRRPVENNTTIIRRDNGDLAVRLHDTDVVTYHADDSVTLDSGGWLTVTTKDRMNYALGMRPVHIGSAHGHDQGPHQPLHRDQQDHARVQRSGTLVSVRTAAHG